MGTQPVSQGFIHTGLPTGTASPKGSQYIRAVPHSHLFFEWPPVWPACTRMAKHYTTLFKNSTFPI